MEEIKSVAGAIFSKNREKILLVKRKDVPVWVLPGGGIDLDESSKDAVIREILEETGFTVKVKRLVALYLPINSLTKPTHLYECEILGGTPTPSDETTAVEFFPLDAIPKYTPPPFREWIFDAHKDIPFFTKKLTWVNYKILFKNSILHPILVIRFSLSLLKKLF